MEQLEEQKIIGVKSFNNNDDLDTYFTDLRNTVQNQWNQTLEFMNGYNMDLSWSSKPLLDTTYKSHQTNRKVRLVMIDDIKILEIMNKKYNKNSDVILQLWDVQDYKSIILLINIREDSDRDWKDERLPLSKQEKVLTSWLLDTSDGITGHPFYVVDDVVKSISDKNSFYNVFSVLN